MGTYNKFSVPYGWLIKQFDYLLTYLTYNVLKSQWEYFAFWCAWKSLQQKDAEREAKSRAFKEIVQGHG